MGGHTKKARRSRASAVEERSRKRRLKRQKGELKAVKASNLQYLGPAPEPAQPDRGAVDGPPEFVPSVKWHGRRDGFCFKLGTRGVGYYVDTNQAAPSGVPLPVCGSPKPVMKRTNAAINRFAVLMQHHRHETG